jgi:hypothetical protein
MSYIQINNYVKIPIKLQQDSTVTHFFLPSFLPLFLFRVFSIGAGHTKHTKYKTSKKKEKKIHKYGA